MDFDTAKENIQPLASGRNAEHLETALNAESDHEIQQKLLDQRREFERKIANYSGDDPLQPWYDYIVWVEQIYPKSGKESALHELISKCLALFEKDERYFQDRRMIKLYIKYIDSEPNPPQFYEQLYKNGIGTMVADLYLCWAHYYDYLDNFEKAESIYQMGLGARAQPIELIEQAHRQFGFSMSQRLLYKDDESTQRKFRSSMDEQRLALTSLRAHRHRHVGSIRTGSAVKSHQPGRVEQHDLSIRQSNQKVQVFEDTSDAPTSPIASTSVVQSILNSTRKQENLREPGPWNKAKIKTHTLFSGVSTSKPSFPILEDDDNNPPIPLPASENFYSRGIQLPKDFVRQNLPQDEFLFPLHRDEDPSKNTTYRYDKFMVFPASDKSYSLEELWAYKWFKKRNITNKFTRTQDTVWENGHGIPIRLPPHFVRRNTKQDDWTLDPINFEEALANGQRKFGFDINLIYTQNGEFSMEEILQAKWLNGDLFSQKEAEMDLTCGFERREEIYVRNANRRSMALGGRKSILPPKSVSPRKSIGARKSLSGRKSLAPPSLPEVVEVSQPNLMGVAGGAINRTSLPKRKSIYTAHTLETLTTIPEKASPPTSRRKIDEENEVATANHSKPNPIPFNIFEDGEQAENDEQIFKVPQSAAPLQKTRFSTGFQDEDLDGCTTQTFNFYIKSQAISTPKAERQYAKLADSDGVAALQKGLDFGNDYDTMPGDEQTAVKQPFACRSSDVDPVPFVMEQHEIYRQKLSAIMETTEEGATASTVSSLAATASSKSASAEEFDFTKHTNQQSSVAMSTMYRHQTIINNTAKMSSSNVSVTNRENETKRGVSFDIYQEDASRANDTVAVQLPTHVSKIADSSTAMVLQTDLQAFDKTLPSAAQFHIYEDEDTKKAEAEQIESNVTKLDSTLVQKIHSPKSGKPNQSVFEMSQLDTMPSSWNSKSTANHNVSLVPDKSIVKPVDSKSAFTTKGEQDLTTTTAGALPQVPSKSVFNVLQEDTGLTLPVINFAAERTAQLPLMPALFNQSNLTQMMPPENTETITMCMPEIPDIPDIPDDDTTTPINMSKIFKTDAPTIEPIQTINQSSVHNRSVFQFASEDTVTNVFSANDEKLQSNSNIPNPMQISLISTDTTPMVSEMPTLPGVDFQAEARAKKSLARNESKFNSTTAGGDTTNADQSFFHGFPADGKSKLHQSQPVQPQYINELSKIDHSKHASIFINAQQTKSEAQKSTVNENLIANKTVTKSSQSKTNIDDDFFAMINTTSKQSPTITSAFVVEHTPITEKPLTEQTGPVVGDSFHASVIPTVQVSTEKESSTSDTNRSIFSKSKHTIDDEFYAMIRSPVRKTERTLAEGMIIIDTPPSPRAQASIRQTMAVDIKPNLHKISQLQNPTSASLEPIKNVSMQLQPTVHNTQAILPSNRKSSIDEITRAFSEENPNTAMFSLHMPFIKNSTILMASNETINNISDDLKSNLTLHEDAPMVRVQENLIEKCAETPSDVSVNKVDTVANRSELNKETSAIQLKSIHIKEEALSFEKKPVDEFKLHKNIDDEIFECIQEKDTETIKAFNISIQFTEAEMATTAPPVKNLPVQIHNHAPQFMICNPVSIRQSQFPMNATTTINETIADGEPNPMYESSKDFQLDITKLNSDTIGQEDTSVIIIEEDTEEMAAANKSALAVNSTRRETMNSPYKNHFATNPKLNETINAIKEIDPFDMHLQNALLDDIDFVEYIKSLENVHMTTRVRPIEVNTDVQIGSETFHIVEQIGRGSFGFVFSGKSAKTGKMYALKQERPANLWEFYISLEIPTRVADSNIVPGFTSMEHVVIGHNSSIFVTELSEYGSLYDVCNRHKLNTCRYLDEVIAMIFSEQMLSILDHLHASNIIHGDLKPDNFLLMKKLSYGNNELVLKLIDYGRSIDLNFFPPNQTFTTALNTKNFICTEILENRPWKQQIDLFCLASTMYTLVCGKYMNIKKQIGSLIRPYVLADGLAAYLDVPLWEHVLYSLINVRDHSSLPDLQKLRLRIRESIVEKEHIIHDRITKFNAILDA